MNAPTVYVPPGITAASRFLEAYDPNESLSDGIRQGFGVMSYKGKIWTLRYRGNDYMFTRPEDGTPMPYIDCVILRKSPGLSKTYFEGAYVDGDTRRPDCSSAFGDVPDPDIESPQSTNCSVCPRNVFKVSPEGRKGKECRDFKRLAILLLPTDTEVFFGQGKALYEPILLTVPPASLTDLDNYATNLRQWNLPYFAVVTRVGFAPTPHPQLTFRFQQALTNDEAPVILGPHPDHGAGLREHLTAKRITNEDQAGLRGNITRLPPAQGPVATGIGNQGAQAQVIHPPQAQVVPMQRRQPVPTVAPTPAPAPTVAPVAPPPPRPAFGQASAPSAPAPALGANGGALSRSAAAAAAPATTEPAMAVEVTDDELENRIGGIMAKIRQ